MTRKTRSSRRLGPAAFCRMDSPLLAAARNRIRLGRVACAASLVVAGGTLAYGFVFGLWRSPLQGLYAAVKLPALFATVIAASGLLNTMLAQVLGARLALRQVCLLMLLGMAVASAILGALSPVVLFFVLQVPPPDPRALGLPTEHPDVAASMRVFWLLLLPHVAVIGFAGLVGNIRLYRLLREAVPSRPLALRVMAAWIIVTGFVGCELSWLFSPFLCKPTFPPHFFARTYFEGNFYEHIYHALRELL